MYQLTPPIGPDEQSVVALKNVIFKTFKGALRTIFWCDDVHSRPRCRDNEDEKLERLEFVRNQAEKKVSQFVPLSPLVDNPHILGLFRSITIGTLRFGALNLHTIIRALPLISNILQLRQLR